MWLSFDSKNGYELWLTKPVWDSGIGEFQYSGGNASPEFDFCRMEFEDFLPRLKLKQGEIRQFKVVPIGRKQRAK